MIINLKRLLEMSSLTENDKYDIAIQIAKLINDIHNKEHTVFLDIRPENFEVNIKGDQLIVEARHELRWDYAKSLSEKNFKENLGYIQSHVNEKNIKLQKDFDAEVSKIINQAKSGGHRFPEPPKLKSLPTQLSLRFGNVKIPNHLNIDSIIYLAPEVKNNTVSRKTDIYALATMLYRDFKFSKYEQEYRNSDPLERNSISSLVANLNNAKNPYQIAEDVKLEEKNKIEQAENQRIVDEKRAKEGREKLEKEAIENEKRLQEAKKAEAQLKLNEELAETKNLIAEKDKKVSELETQGLTKEESNFFEKKQNQNELLSSFIDSQAIPGFVRLDILTEDNILSGPKYLNESERYTIAHSIVKKFRDLLQDQNILINNPILLIKIENEKPVLDQIFFHPDNKTNFSELKEEERYLNSYLSNDELNQLVEVKALRLQHDYFYEIIKQFQMLDVSENKEINTRLKELSNSLNNDKLFQLLDESYKGQQPIEEVLIKIQSIKANRIEILEQLIDLTHNLEVNQDAGLDEGIILEKQNQSQFEIQKLKGEIQSLSIKREEISDIKNADNLILELNHFVSNIESDNVDSDAQIVKSWIEGHESEAQLLYRNAKKEYEKETPLLLRESQDEYQFILQKFKESYATFLIQPGYASINESIQVKLEALEKTQNEIDKLRNDKGSSSKLTELNKKFSNQWNEIIELRNHFESLIGFNKLIKNDSALYNKLNDMLKSNDISENSINENERARLKELHGLLAGVRDAIKVEYPNSVNTDNATIKNLDDQIERLGELLKKNEISKESAAFEQSQSEQSLWSAIKTFFKDNLPERVVSLFSQSSYKNELDAIQSQQGQNVQRRGPRA